MNKMMSDQRTVLVTGVSSGIGLALAKKLLESGYSVIGSVRKLGDAAPLVSAWAERFLPLVMDVTDPLSIADAAEIVKSHLGGRNLKALINNAGISINGPMMYQPLDEVRSVFEVNVFSLLAVTQAFLPLLGVGGSASTSGSAPGRIVNIGSASGAITVPFMGAYSASKHAIEALTQALRRELIPWGVEVVVIEPGFIRSSMHKKEFDREKLPQYSSTIYAALWDRFERFMQANEQRAKSPEMVTKAVLHAIEDKRPRTRYPLDNIWYIGRILPDRWFDKFLLLGFRFDRAD